MNKRFVLLAMSLFLVCFILATQNGLSAAEKPIELKFAHFLPATYFQHVEVFVPFAKEVRSRARIVLTSPQPFIFPKT